MVEGREGGREGKEGRREGGRGGREEREGGEGGEGGREGGRRGKEGREGGRGRGGMREAASPVQPCREQTPTAAIKGEGSDRLLMVRKAHQCSPSVSQQVPYPYHIPSRGHSRSTRREHQQSLYGVAMVAFAYRGSGSEVPQSQFVVVGTRQDKIGTRRTTQHTPNIVLEE